MSLRSFSIFHTINSVLNYLKNLFRAGRTADSSLSDQVTLHMLFNFCVVLNTGLIVSPVSKMLTIMHKVKYPSIASLYRMRHKLELRSKKKEKLALHVVSKNTLFPTHHHVFHYHLKHTLYYALWSSLIL